MHPQTSRLVEELRTGVNSSTNHRPECRNLLPEVAQVKRVPGSVLMLMQMLRRRRRVVGGRRVLLLAGHGLQSRRSHQGEVKTSSIGLIFFFFLLSPFSNKVLLGPALFLPRS